ncbi:MAG: hypothetical protein ACJ0QC_01620 [Flavobacteriales bacterium]
MISFLAFLLLDPIVKSSKEIKEKPVVVILQDVSSSINKNIKNELEDFSSKLKDLDIFKYSFSDNIYDDFSEKNNGLYTNISKVINEINNRFSNRNLSSIILASDGLYNDGVNPLYSDNLKTPIHSICLGDTIVKKDNLISDVKHNDIVFFGNSFISEIFIESVKYKNEKVSLKVENNGETLFEKNITFNSNKEFIKIPVELKTSQVGVQAFKVVISPLESENNTRNNTFVFYVDVIDSKYKILFIHDNSHPDIASVVSVIENNKDYDLDVVRSNNLKTKFLDYNLIILHSISKENSQIIDDISKENIPLLIFPKQELNLYSKLIPNITFKRKSFNNEVFPYINDEFLSFKISKGVEEMINFSPPILTSFGFYNSSALINTVAYQKYANTITESPLFFFDSYNGSKIGVFLGEGYWRWKINDFKLNDSFENFDELINKVLQYLIIKEDKSKFRLYYEKESNENENIVFEAEVYDDNYNLNNDNDISLMLVNSNNEEYRYVFNKKKEKYYLDLGNLNPDSYKIFAKVEKRNYQKNGLINIKPVNIEFLNKIANHQILNDLSKITGGKSYNLNNLNLLINNLNNNKDSFISTRFEDKLIQLIDYELILLILLVLISFEWFVRKYNGLI